MSQALRVQTANAKTGAMSSSIIPIHDLNRMTMYANSTKDQSRADDKRRLKELSDARIQNWPNTVTAIRKKKEAERFEKFKKEELERRELEQDEAKFQAEEKRKLLDRCKKQIWDRRDRVKAFHSKLLVSDALDERNLQLQIKGEQVRHKKEVDDWHHDQLIKKCIEYDKQEEKKKKQMEEKRKLTQQVLKNQHDEFKRKHIETLQEEILEGELIKRKAIEANAKGRLEEEKKRAAFIEAQKESFKQNEIAKELKKQMIEKEKEEDEKIYQYGIKKMEELDARKKAEQDRAAEKRRRQAEMVAAAEKKLREAMDQEAVFLIKQKKDKELKEAEEERKKLARKEYLKNTMEENRQIWMKEKKLKDQKLIDDDKKFQAQWVLKNQEIEKKEKNEHDEIRTMNKNLQKFH